MSKDSWKLILQVVISILTAIATTLGVTSCI
ncbi:MAG: smalltalk protein [Prevotellaceae bacterium]|nr:smalltalk protein [Prevotellaceae bacterium]